MSRLISKLDLVHQGYSEYLASKIIRETKQLLVKQGFSYYSRGSYLSNRKNI